MSRNQAANGGNEPQPSPPRPNVVMPPAPPGESSPQQVQKTRAVAEALSELGEQAKPKEIARQVKSHEGIAMGVGEAAAIKEAVIEKAKTPPGPDQPPPDQVRQAEKKGE